MKNIFIDENNAIDKESLRLFALDKLQTSKDELNLAMSRPVWDQLHNVVGSGKDDAKLKLYRKSESQLLGLDGFIDSFIKTALDSSERFEFFVEVKASELKSKDKQHDYYWALQIRHDQIIALVKVVERTVTNINKWSKNSAEEILLDEEFIKLAHTSIEDKVYLEAERVYKERNKVLE